MAQPTVAEGHGNGGDDSSDEDDFADLFAPETMQVPNDAVAGNHGSEHASYLKHGNSKKITWRGGSSGGKQRRPQKMSNKNRNSKVPSGYSGIVLEPTAEQMRKDLNRGCGIVVAKGGGLRKQLNTYGNEIQRRTTRILEMRGHVLGKIVAEQRDMARFLALRDVQMWVIVRRWTRQLMRVNLRAWYGLVKQAKEDAERFRKLFVKSDRQRLKKCFKVLRHAADMGMAQRANAELNNQSADAEQQSQKIRDLEGRAKESRHKISSLEYQLESMAQERDEVKDQVKQLRELLDQQKKRELELAKIHREQMEAAMAAAANTSENVLAVTVSKDDVPTSV